MPPAASESVVVRLNGADREISPGTTISSLLADLGLEEDRVAVELNREIVGRRHWPNTTLVAGSSLEVVHFVGGG